MLIPGVFIFLSTHSRVLISLLNDLEFLRHSKGQRISRGMEIPCSGNADSGIL
jgi:hypothetical protein